MPGSISLKGVTVFSSRFPLLRGVNYTVPENSAVIITGRSGCGKSTLLELMAGLRTPDRGQVLWDGVAIASFTRKKLLTARQTIGYMFQQHALIANYSVFDNIALPLRTGGGYSEREIATKVHAILEEVALFDIDTLFPETLSAGQQKRAALARALVTDPDMLLLDEPVSGIDAQTAEGIQSIVTHTQIERNRTVVIVSHDTAGWEMLRAECVTIEGGKTIVTESAAGSGREAGVR